MFLDDDTDDVVGALKGEVKVKFVDDDLAELGDVFEAVIGTAVAVEQEEEEEAGDW